MCFAYDAALAYLRQKDRAVQFIYPLKKIRKSGVQGLSGSARMTMDDVFVRLASKKQQHNCQTPQT